MFGADVAAPTSSRRAAQRYSVVSPKSLPQEAAACTRLAHLPFWPRYAATHRCAPACLLLAHLTLLLTTWCHKKVFLALPRLESTL